MKQTEIGHECEILMDLKKEIPFDLITETCSSGPLGSITLDQ